MSRGGVCVSVSVSVLCVFGMVFDTMICDK